MAWNGESRKHSLARKGIKVAKGSISISINDFQNRVIAGQDFIDEIKSVGRRKIINPDGTITLYHGSSPENINQIKKTGLRDQSFLSLTAEETKEHIHQHNKKEILQLDVDARDIEFSTGTQEIYVPDGLIRDQDGIWKSPKRIKGMK